MTSTVIEVDDKELNAQQPSALPEIPNVREVSEVPEPKSIFVEEKGK